MRSTLPTIHDPSLGRDFYAKGLWQDITLYGTAKQHTQTRPDGYAVRDRQRRLTWSQLVQWADALAGELHAAGLLAGDCVAGWLPSRVECFVLYLACSRNGYVCTLSLHQNHTVDEVFSLLERIGASAFVGQSGYGADSDRKDIYARLSQLPTLRRAYALPALDALESALPAVARAFPGMDVSLSLPEADDNPDKVVYLAFTSGTTGMPKALMHSDNTLLANGRALVKDWSLNTQTILYCLGPLSHHLATVGFLQHLVAGFEFVTNDLPKGMKVIDRIIETQADLVMGVPTHAIDMIQEMRGRGLEKLGKVKTFYMSGASIPAELVRQLISLGITPQSVYGMSENGSHHSTAPDDSAETTSQTVGQAVGRHNPAYEVRIWKSEDRDVEAVQGEIGEIGGQGAVLMLGYFNNDAATQDSFNSSGWFMSGDLGRLDERGNLQVVGRSKDLIIRGGHNIYPADIENIALRHPCIAKAAAFPVPDARLGEKVCLGVIPVAGAVLDAHELLAHLHQEGLSKYDMPEYYMCVESFPMTASGKILKRELTEQVKHGHIHPEPVRWKADQEVANV
ncbi:acyl--CoA ligase [Pseudomonas synxantha]|uniref:Acyl--CoA ligase n=1 Tax=Pseudomonas synxantha TaxID=47883 RepID=A0ABS0UC63_9PSED|nr:class I adenylate-forming enzyme family protein [Pseudomonas synxantha]MBI6563160.1 acyl--CoA ligase [Pseudomonas synxantha]MBI6583398.1 acyl--CoA ligase [Pseudomonas synxantha]MBI6646766.1 acyl--CoA ligase [Pseudomonas synxantha]